MGVSIADDWGQSEPPADEWEEVRTPKSGVDYTNFHDLFTTLPQPAHWFASPVVAAGRATLLYSPGKAGKSLIAMEIAAAVATGMPVLGSPAQEPVEVLYIDQEMIPDDWRERLTDMGYDASDAPMLDKRLHLAQLQSWPSMDTWMGGAAVLGEVQRHDARLVVIDTASKVVGGEENANDTHSAFYRHTVVPLKRLGCGVLILDHTGKDVERGARGGSAKTDNVDLAFELLVRGRDLLSLRCSHARFRDPALDAPAFIQRHLSPLRHELEGRRAPTDHGPGVRPTNLMEKVSRYVAANPGTSGRTIRTTVPGKEAYVLVALELLINEGYIHAESGPNRTTVHRQLNPFREHEEPRDESLL